MSARIEAWMRQAESDFRVGQLTEAQNFHSQACYHYGQTAEKALKGLLDITWQHSSIQPFPGSPGG